VVVDSGMSPLVHYLEKENPLNKKSEPEYLLNGQQI